MSERTIDKQVVEFLTGLRSQIMATVWRQLKAENKALTYGNTLDELRKIRMEWLRDTTDDSREKHLYIAILNEEIEKIETRLAS